MSGLCGIAGAAAHDRVAAMAPEIERLHAGRRDSVSCAYGALAMNGSAASVSVCSEDALAAGVFGHARFKDKQLAALCAQRGAAHALAEAWRRHGVDAFAQLEGTFAVALIDAEAQQAAIAVDRMATRPLCYASDGGAFAFASTLDALRAAPGSEASLDPQAIYDYLYFHVVPGPRTIYRNRHKLEAGHYLLWRDGRAEAVPYWQPRFDERRRDRFAELKADFLAAIRESVRDAVAGRPAGTFLSGGTDSSTLAGMLCEVTGKPARTFSLGFEAEGYDEMEYARIAARHFGTEHHEYYVTPQDVVEAIPAIATAHDQPFGNASAVPTYFCARLAKQHGVELLLGGDGGDELFGGNARYVHQYLLSLYSDLPATLRKGLIEPFAFLLPEAGLIGKGQRYIRYASTPMPQRYDNYNLLERLGARNVFTDDFLATVDPDSPRREMGTVYARSEGYALINRMLALDFKYTLADNDLPKVVRSCELADTDVRFPMLDDRVLDFSLGLEPDLKLRGTRLRYFFKEALRGFLPEQIITKTKHGFGLPVGPWLRSHPGLKALAADGLAALKNRGIIRPAFIDDLSSARMQEHAAYYGNMVWNLVMLEVWLSQRPLSVTS
ncbi:MAG: asparagine synthetase B family protein [Betaproteobacteria bacterium]